MSKADRGKRIVSVAKSLKRYSLADQQISAFLYASSHAGRAGLVASALRANDIPWPRATVLAANEGFSPIELRKTILPWLQESGLCAVEMNGDTIVSVSSIVLSYDNILTSVSDLYDSLGPAEEDIGCLQLLDLASRMPIAESDALHSLAKQLGSERRARTAVSLAKSYGLVDFREGFGLTEPVLYSVKLWGACITKAASAIGALGGGTAQQNRARRFSFALHREDQFSGAPLELICLSEELLCPIVITRKVGDNCLLGNIHRLVMKRANIHRFSTSATGRLNSTTTA